MHQTNTGSRPLLIGFFLFLYLPFAYSSGWALLPGSGLDFPSYYHAARFAFLFHITPYGSRIFPLLPGFMGDKVQPYIYPPPSLLVFWPLAHLSLENARAAFLLASHLCYLLSIWLMLGKLTPFPRDERRATALAISLVYLLSFDAAFATLALGQINILALLFICLALTAMKCKSSAWRIALPLSIAIVLKTYPVFLIVVLLFRKQFRAVWLTGLFSALVTALAFLVLPGTVWMSWYRFALPAGAYATEIIHQGYAFNQSLNAFVIRLTMENFFSKAPLFYPSVAKPLATALALLIAGITVFSSFRVSRLAHPENSGDDEVAAYLLMIYLIAPISWDHHLVYILPAALLAIAWILNGSARGKTAVMLAAALFLIAWRLPIGSRAITNGWWTLLLSAKLYPVLALWIFFIVRLYRAYSPASTFTNSYKNVCPS